MANTHGQLVVCDRCGESTFSKFLKTENCGFCYRYHFEPLPDGWEERPGVGMLCPSCNKKYNSTIDDFMHTYIPREG